MGFLVYCVLLQIGWIRFRLKERGETDVAKESLNKLKQFSDLMQDLPTLDVIAIVGVFLTDFINNGSDKMEKDRHQQWNLLKQYLDHIYIGLTTARDAGIKEGYDFICELFDDEEEKEEKPQSRIILPGIGRMM